MKSNPHARQIRILDCINRNMIRILLLILLHHHCRAFSCPADTLTSSTRLFLPYAKESVLFLKRSSTASLLFQQSPNSLRGHFTMYKPAMPQKPKKPRKRDKVKKFLQRFLPKKIKFSAVNDSTLQKSHPENNTDTFVNDPSTEGVQLGNTCSNDNDSINGYESNGKFESDTENEFNSEFESDTENEFNIEFESKITFSVKSTNSVDECKSNNESLGKIIDCIDEHKSKDEFIGRNTQTADEYELNIEHESKFEHESKLKPDLKMEINKLRIGDVAGNEVVTDVEVEMILDIRNRIEMLKARGEKNEMMQMSPWITSDGLTDFEILRFIRFNHNKIEKAWTQLISVAIWRKKEKVDTVLDEYEEWESFLEAKKELYWSEPDKNGLPTLTLRAVHHHPGALDASKFTRYLVYLIEKGRKEQGIGICRQCNILVDRVGSGMKNQDPELLRTMLPIFRDNYPDAVHRAYIAPSNLIFMLIWSIARVLVDARQRARVVLLGGKMWEEELLDVFDPAVLPTHLGGTQRIDDIDQE